MTAAEAQQKIDKLYGCSLKLEKRNGVCAITHPEKGVIGTGPSWLAAVRYAATPIFAARQEQDVAKRRQLQLEEMEARKEATLFGDFLRERFESEFELWKAAQETPAPSEAEPEPRPQVVGSGRFA